MKGMRHKDFACFILTHGRPDKQYTLKTLKKLGYKGAVWLIVDNEDECLEQYRQSYENVIVFDKNDAASISDRGDIVQKKNTVLFARNMCHKIAADLGLEYFLELDDDYSAISHRFIDGDLLRQVRVNDINALFDAYLDFLDVSGALAVCFAQCGDIIGGARDFPRIRCIRKAMNAFFCRTDRPFKFRGRMNDDVNTYVTLAHQGQLFFTCGDVAINQEETQQSSGGLTEMYKENGTYMKSFYTVMMCPSAVKIASMGVSSQRLHHRIDWNACAPKILRPKWQKVKANG